METEASPTTARPAGAKPWRRAAGTLAGALLGAVLLFAAWGKALDPSAFAEQIRTEGLELGLGAPAVALVALGLEVGLGLALLLGVRRLWVLVPAALLVAFFVALTGRAYWQVAHGVRAEAASCGCFGNLVQRSPKAAFWQDLFLLVPPLALAFLGRDATARRFPPLRTAVVAAGTAAALVFAWKAPDLPLDDLATRLRPGVAVRDLCAGAGEQAVCLDTVAPELGRGEHLVVLADLDDPSFGAAVDGLNRYGERPAAPQLSVLAATSPASQTAFFWKWGPTFDIREAPPALLRPLYRRLPRAFLVRDGRVIKTYRGLPPLLELAARERPAGPSPV